MADSVERPFSLLAYADDHFVQISTTLYALLQQRSDMHTRTPSEYQQETVRYIVAFLREALSHQNPMLLLTALRSAALLSEEHPSAQLCASLLENMQSIARLCTLIRRSAFIALKPYIAEDPVTHLALLDTIVEMLEQVVRLEVEQQCQQQLRSAETRAVTE